MTIPEGKVFSLNGHLFFGVITIRPYEDLSRKTVRSKAVMWQVWHQSGAHVGSGEVAERGTAQSSLRRSAKAYLKKDPKRGTPVELDADEIVAIEEEVKMILHAGRDCYRNQGLDTTTMRFDRTEGYYGEAFGIMRGLALRGFGSIGGAVNIPKERKNLRWWLADLERQVLEEENFGGSGECKHCMERYGKDDSTMAERILTCPSCSGNGKVNIAGQTDTCGWCPGDGKVSRVTLCKYRDGTRRGMAPSKVSDGTQEQREEGQAPPTG